MRDGLTTKTTNSDRERENSYFSNDLNVVAVGSRKMFNGLIDK